MKDSVLFLENILKDNDTVVCGVSGGVDSMCLLDVLLKIKPKINIICAHINHNLRKESFEEYEFVKSYCELNNVIFEGIVFDKNITGNFENEARKKRYAFFEEVLFKYKSKYLLTAHHGDDLIETILMRIARGSNIEGYSGFKLLSDRNNYKILRPFIYVTKDYLYKYAKDNNIEYREDKSNLSNMYTRNRYRHNILPLLKEENQNIHLKFLKFNEELNDINNFINNYISLIYNDIFNNNKLDVCISKKLDKYILKRLISKILINIYSYNINYINDKHINNIINVIYSNKPNIMIDLPLGVKVIKKYNVIEIKNIELTSNYNYIIDNKDIMVPTGKIKYVSETNLTNNFVCHLNSKNIKLPLHVRNKEDGDYIEILGLNGKKKVKDIFINEKVDIEKRKVYPIVVDDENNIVWIPGLKKSKYDTLKTKNYDIILWYIDKEENNE